MSSPVYRLLSTLNPFFAGISLLTSNSSFNVSDAIPEFRVALRNVALSSTALLSNCDSIEALQAICIRRAKDQRLDPHQSYPKFQERPHYERTHRMEDPLELFSSLLYLFRCIPCPLYLFSGHLGKLSTLAWMRAPPQSHNQYP